MSSIQSYISEIKNLNIELKRINKQATGIRKRIKDLEQNIINYLSKKEQPGVKFQDIAIVVENKTKREYKAKKDKEDAAIKILENRGISDSKYVLEQILEARRGNPVEDKKIKIKKINKI